MTVKVFLTFTILTKLLHALNSSKLFFDLPGVPHIGLDDEFVLEGGGGSRMYTPTSIPMNRICQPVRFFPICPEYVAII